MGKFLSYRSNIIHSDNFIFRYPSAIIDKQFRFIFGNSISSDSILPLINDEAEFIQLRKRYMKQPTARQSQLQARFAQHEDKNQDHDDERSATTTSTVNNQAISHKFDDKVIIHYTHAHKHQR